MKKVNNFPVPKVQTQGVAQLLLDFLPISAWHSYKSVAYIKKSVYEKRIREKWEEAMEQNNNRPPRR